MKIFSLPLDINLLGSDPIDHLYSSLNIIYPTYELTKLNSTILKIQPAATSEFPNLTYLKIQKGDDAENIYEFFYNRYNINDYLTNPIFNEDELEEIVQLQNSAELVEQLAVKVNLNFKANDFWTSINSLDFAGGTVTPNWKMQAVYDSVYWCGDMYVWLHT